MKKKRNYVQFTCKMDKDLLEKLKRTTLDYDLESINVLINDCIKFAIKNMKIED